MDVVGRHYGQTADEEWLELVETIMREGSISAPRGRKIKEMIGCQTAIDMAYPVVNIEERKLGKRFMCAEAAWILSGDNRVASIKNYSPTIENFSDDGVYYHGAYGPKIVDQLTYAVDMLCEDPDTRQAVINIWRENPRKSKDIPCTISVQFLIRNGRLHVIDTMRSSDAWLGIVYDWFNFTMLAGYVLLLIRERKMKQHQLWPTSLGTLYLNAGSEHLYESNWPAVENILSGPQTPWQYAPFDPLNQFVSPGHLIEHLWRLANKDETLWNSPCQWLVPQLLPNPIGNQSPLRRHGNGPLPGSDVAVVVESGKTKFVKFPNGPCPGCLLGGDSRHTCNRQL